MTDFIIMYCSFFSLADAENAFKVRLSIRTALGDKAVSADPACSLKILFANNTAFSDNEPVCIVILNLHKLLLKTSNLIFS